MLGLHSFVLELPENGTPVPKHVAVHTCRDLKFIMCICQLMYYCMNMHDVILKKKNTARIMI